MVVVDNHVIRTGSLARLVTSLMHWVSCLQLQSGVGMNNSQFSCLWTTFRQLYPPCTVH